MSRGRTAPPVMSTFFAFLHHLAAFVLVSALAVEFVLLGQELTLANARKLPIVDAVLGVSAGLLLLVGLLRVFYFEKGALYYFSSHAFLTKFAAFLIVALLSVVRTVEFLSWRKALGAGQVPVVDANKMRRLRLLIHVELAGIVIILLSAAMMARGGWR
jgi:putative membrane protein